MIRHLSPEQQPCWLCSGRGGFCCCLSFVISCFASLTWFFKVRFSLSFKSTICRSYLSSMLLFLSSSVFLVLSGSIEKMAVLMVSTLSDHLSTLSSSLTQVSKPARSLHLPLSSYHLAPSSIMHCVQSPWLSEHWILMERLINMLALLTFTKIWSLRRSMPWHASRILAYFLIRMTRELHSSFIEVHLFSIYYLETSVLSE